ncbi:MAG: hypothetical protein D6767_06990 [Candidatus Hydrogenedentota bacterium]|nr:MAG: hypothetical protein D6767_06990 [Candidatus Hydrogenedentota bacterium]
MKKILSILLGLCSVSLYSWTASPSIGGTTGLITTPTANVAWGKSSFGFNLGTHFIADKNNSITPKATIGIAGKAELGATYDIQDKESNDLLLHGKFRFHQSGDTALAIGGNFQSINYGPNFNDTAGQIYLATTYGASFFKMPSETTIVFGKTFAPGAESNIDFSMGFDLNLAPSVFKGYIHWLLDFANYSYSIDPRGAGAGRGIFNTGIRVAVLRDSPNMLLNLDLMILDALDTNRSFGAGLAFGMAF